MLAGSANRLIMAKKWLGFFSTMVLAVLMFASVPAKAQNVLIATTNESATFDGGAGLNIVNNFINEISTVPGVTTTLEQGDLTTRTMSVAEFSGYDAVFIMSVYQPITSANVTNLRTAMNAAGSNAFVLFIDTCGSVCTPANGTALVNMVNDVSPFTAGLGTAQSTNPAVGVRNATSYMAATMTRTPFTGAAYSPFTGAINANFVLYNVGSNRYMLGVPAQYSPDGVCLIAANDTSAFSTVPVANFYNGNRGIGQNFINTLTNPNGMCARFTLNVRKSLPVARGNAADQFALAASGNTLSATATTTGTGATANGAATLAGSGRRATYTVSEAMAPGSVSTASSYSATYACTNSVTGTGTVMPSGTGMSFTIQPRARDNITCTFTNRFIVPLTILKSSLVFSDPVTTATGGTNPKQIPGSFTTYTLTVSNPGTSALTANSVVVIDPLPAVLSLFTGNMGGAGSGPVQFTAGTSGLTFTFTSLSSTTDNVDFSNNGGASWTYTPIVNGDGVDPAVTHIRIRPQGVMAAGSSFTLRFRAMVE